MSRLMKGYPNRRYACIRKRWTVCQYYRLCSSSDSLSNRNCNLQPDRKSQLQNKEKAFALLRAKLYDIECQKAHDAEAEARRSQIGTGDRSEKIRTYNFPQGRVTDHRINLTLYKLDKIMNGDIQEILDALIAADQAAKLAKMNEN